MDYERIWREFPKTVSEFDQRFPDDDACRRFLVELRWGGRPRCSRCGSEKMWELGSGRFECSVCGYQMSVTAGTPLHKTKKPLKLWFRAMWEIATHWNGISAKDLQRTLGFGSYKTAWTWLHKLRRCLLQPDREPLRGPVQLDDTYIGGRDDRPGRPKGNKALVLVAAEPNGRMRLEHSPDLTKKSIRSFAERNLAESTSVTTDGYRSFSARSLSPRKHEQHVQRQKRHIKNDPLEHAHFAMALVKRMWIGTYHGGVSRKYLQTYLDEFEFRYNRRRTRGVGRLMARLLQQLVNAGTITYDNIRITTTTFGRFETA